MSVDIDETTVTSYRAAWNDIVHVDVKVSMTFETSQTRAHSLAFRFLYLSAVEMFDYVDEAVRRSLRFVESQIVCLDKQKHDDARQIT
jgi:hypothetical protein